MLSNTTIKYYIFKCLNIACNEIIPVQFFSSKDNSSFGSLRQIQWAEGVNENLTSVDAKCPFCKKIHNFQINQNIREISKREFNAELTIANARTSFGKGGRIIFLGRP